MNHNVITISLLGLTAVLLSSGTAWAGVTVPIAVPEPASIALLAAGVAGLAWSRFRRRK